MSDTDFVVKIMEGFSFATIEEAKQRTEKLFGVTVVHNNQLSSEWEEMVEECESLAGHRWIKVSHASPDQDITVRQARDFFVACFEPETVVEWQFGKAIMTLLNRDDHIWRNRLQRNHVVVIHVDPSSSDNQNTVSFLGEVERVEEVQEELCKLERAFSCTEKKPQVRRDFLDALTVAKLEWSNYGQYPSAVMQILHGILDGKTGKEPPNDADDSVIFLESRSSDSPLITRVLKPSKTLRPPTLPSTSHHDTSDIKLIEIEEVDITDTPERPNPKKKVKVTEEHEEYAGPQSPEYILRPIVIDACNVGFSHGGGKALSCKGIALAVKWFLERGHHVDCFMPENYSLKAEAPRHDKPIRDRHIIHQLVAIGLLHLTPVKTIADRFGREIRFENYDDLIILDRATQISGIVISRDRYRDISRKKDEYREVINKCLQPIWIRDDLAFPPDGPEGRYGLGLEETLRISTADNNVFLCLQYRLTKSQQNEKVRQVTEILSGVGEKLVDTASKTIPTPKSQPPNTASTVPSNCVGLGNQSPRFHDDKHKLTRAPLIARSHIPSSSVNQSNAAPIGSASPFSSQEPGTLVSGGGVLGYPPVTQAWWDEEGRVHGSPLPERIQTQLLDLGISSEDVNKAMRENPLCRDVHFLADYIFTNKVAHPNNNAPPDSSKCDIG